MECTTLAEFKDGREETKGWRDIKGVLNRETWGQEVEMRQSERR